MKTSEFDYRLPPELIAQVPLAERDSSRLMVLERASGNVSHHVFRDLPELLRPGDLLVLNDTRVVPARLLGWREQTGGKVEVLLLERIGEKTGEGAPERWHALAKSGGKLRPGEYLKLAGGRVRARLVARLEEPWSDILELESREPIEDVMETAGSMPVPPYVKRRCPRTSCGAPEPDAMTLLDRERYQTVYARVAGAVAAPTAGLHFTERVFRDLAERGIERVFVTLHVGPGTFRPLKSESVEEHRMQPERYEIPPRTAEAVERTRARGGRVVAVGTTVTRTLECAGGIRLVNGRGAPPPLQPPARTADRKCCHQAMPRRSRRTAEPSLTRGEAGLFITPGYEFKAVDVLLTNFHLPRGTPLLLVSAFARVGPEEELLAGRDRVLAAYAEAIRERYRFFSYGDAMLLV